MPTYRRCRESGPTVVIAGRGHYLGEFGAVASRDSNTGIKNHFADSSAFAWIDGLIFWSRKKMGRSSSVEWKQPPSTSLIE